MQLNVTTLNGRQLSVEWTKTIPLVKHFAWAQHGRFMDFDSPESMSDEVFVEVYQNVLQGRWNTFESNVLAEMPPDAVIVNIGSGIGTIDVLAADFLEASTHILVDGATSSYVKGNPYFSESADGHGTYNSWSPLFEVLHSQELISRFKILPIGSDWSTPVDAVYSSYSLCWHYPLDAYWSQVVNSLRTGGKLLLDIFNANSDSIDVISRAMNNDPIVVRYKTHKNSGSPQKFIVDGSHGGSYCWTRCACGH